MSEPPSGRLCLPDSQGDLWTWGRWLREMDDEPRSPLEARLFHPLTRRLDACATVNFVEMIKVQFNHQGSPWGNILPMKAHEIYNLLLSLTFKGPIK